ncbi:hypothetical protein HYH02_008145 [Chlamydomonas schloesseri]|uniref:SM/Sec1-family protein n=1 Tax=Chlamydomonas schloesseri TaxID=2026947 RepID=A0A836B3X7_9CHLO|nr:hypothetical protein HYH02_008145 [Chlamydomonas schloesseri]|eukprot:KAG2446991.1 hypothetical protein HYH02_008145 [Chlamydomonas schloesseri]
MESCRKAVKERILDDMLGSVKDTTGGGWKVLIVDKFTTRVLSSTLRMSDILDCGVSVVEDLAKAREPMQQPAVYFIQPTPESISRVLDDFGGPEGKVGVGKQKSLYPTAHIFLSNKLPAEAVEKLKANPRLLKALKTLKELNLEFLTVDCRTMITDHPDAGSLLLSDACEREKTAVTRQVDSIVSRLSTLFTSLKEFPVIRYKNTRAPEPGDPPGQAMRGSLPQLLGGRLYERLAGLQRAGQLPAKETCDLLVLDRSYDAVAPFIHEWSYEALAYDLVHIEGNVYRYETEQQAGGKPETREALLEEGDELWVELRHMFIAEVYSSIANRFKDFQAKSKVARAQGTGLDKKADAASIRQLIVALPQYREQLSRLALHIQLSSELKTATNARSLTEVGELEQDIVLGDKSSKDMLAYFAEHGAQMDGYDKMRLLACYLATHPGKLDVNKRLQWQKATGISGEDMAALCSGLTRMGVRVMEGQSGAEAGGKSSFFGGKKKAAPAKATRKKRGGDDEEEYALNRFQALMADHIEDLNAGRLSLEEFPYVRQPTDLEVGPEKSAASARTARSGLNWTRRKDADGAGGSGGPAGRRLVVFIIGGATRGEMRIAHTLSLQLNRDIILGSTSINVPINFIDMLYNLIPEHGEV